MKILFVFEKGILHYRIPLLEKIAELPFIEKVTVVHAAQYTGQKYKFIEEKIYVTRLGLLRIHHGLKKLFVEHDIIITSFNLWTPSFIPFLFNSKFKSKIVLWGQGFGRKKNYILSQKLRIMLANKAKALIFYTNGGAHSFITKGILKEKIFVGQNSLCINNFGYAEDIQKEQFLYVGRIQKRKGLEELLKSFAIVRKSIPYDVILKIIGDGDTTELLNIANNLNISDKIYFEAGRFDENYLKKEFQKSFAYISPHCIGLGAVHSFAYGIPIVTKKNSKHGPEIEYCINEYNSILYEGTEPVLAQIMIKLILNSSYQKKLGYNAYDFYDKFLRFDKMIKGFINAIKFVAG